MDIDLLLSNVNEPESLTVRIIMRPIIHVGRYFVFYSSSTRSPEPLFLKSSLHACIISYQEVDKHFALLKDEGNL